MRTTFLTLALAFCGIGFAAQPAETTTYVDGNVTGLTPNSGGTLTFDDNKAMHLRTGLTNVAVPYSGLSHAELGAVKTAPHNAPFYKVWERKQKTETQLLVVNFKNQEGDDKTMTLELPQQAAASVLSELETRTGKDFGAKTAAQTTAKTAAKKPDIMAAAPAEKQTDPWWGDDWWKTPRNADKWSKPAGSATSQQ